MVGIQTAIGPSIIAFCWLGHHALDQQLRIQRHTILIIQLLQWQLNIGILQIQDTDPKAQQGDIFGQCIHQMNIRAHSETWRRWCGWIHCQFQAEIKQLATFDRHCQHKYIHWPNEFHCKGATRCILGWHVEDNRCPGDFVDDSTTRYKVWCPVPQWT